MSKLPLLTAMEMEKVLFFLGFRFIRRKGSHAFYKHADGRYTTLPHHQGKQIARPLLRHILNQIDISPEDLLRILDKA